MLRLTVAEKDYIMIGDNIKIVFLGGSSNHQSIMIDAPKDVNIVRNKAMEKRIADPAIKATLPTYYSERDKRKGKPVK